MRPRPPPLPQVTLQDDPVTRTYFAGNDAGHGRQLWQADELVTRGPGEAGTLSFSVGGVRLVADLNPAGASPQDLTAVGGTPVFGGQTGATEVFSAGAPQPAGGVTFFEDGRKIGTRPLVPQHSGGPTASLTITARSATHQIVAVYSGDGHYLPATSNTVPLTGN